MAKDAIQSYINRDMELSKPLASMGEKAHSLYEGVLNSAKDRALGSQHAILAVMAAKCLIKLSDHCLDVGKWAEYAITGRHPRKEAAK
jgi:phosphate uptake regulator